MTFDATSAFQKFQQGSADTIRKTVEQPEFQTAVAFALAEMSSRNCTSDQIAGANIFIQTLCVIGEASAPMPKFPVKRLDTYEPKAD